MLHSDHSCRVVICVLLLCGHVECSAFARKYLSCLKIVHCLLQSIGDDDDTVESSSAEIMQTEEGFAPVFFDPRPLTNLVLIDELESLSPVLDMQACILPSRSMAAYMCC